MSASAFLIDRRIYDDRVTIQQKKKFIKFISIFKVVNLVQKVTIIMVI